MRGWPGNTSPRVPSAGCRDVLPAGESASIIPQPLNLSRVQRATRRCTLASEKHALPLFFFHPPNCIWVAAVLFNRLHVLSKARWQREELQPCCFREAVIRKTQEPEKITAKNMRIIIKPFTGLGMNFLSPSVYAQQSVFQMPH